MAIISATQSVVRVQPIFLNCYWFLSLQRHDVRQQRMVRMEIALQPTSKPEYILEMDFSYNSWEAVRSKTSPSQPRYRILNEPRLLTQECYRKEWQKKTKSIQCRFDLVLSSLDVSFSVILSLTHCPQNSSSGKHCLSKSWTHCSCKAKFVVSKHLNCPDVAAEMT